MNIGIYIYDKAEVLDFSGPFEVFSTASRICRGNKPFNTFLIGQTGKTVIARGGYEIIPKFSFNNSPHIDLLIIAGGVYAEEIKKEPVITWIKEKSKAATIIASVCTGIFLLAKASVVTNQTVTTHWEDIAELKASFPNLNVQNSKRWVADGNVISSAGISAGIDMSLHLITIIYSKMLAEQTAKQMEYHWRIN